MTLNDKKFSNFIGDLKASNITSNITSLNFYSEQINLLLDQIIDVDDNVTKKNIETCRNIMQQAKDVSTSELINDYIRFGDNFQSIVAELKSTQNIKYLKKIAIHYLDIAKVVKDERIKKLAFEIADDLSN